ncbi:unnamed protein product [Cuscuta europaea]|uniref:Uncharacterized protein n=1 Tax=Cuscuta europaea TaxID=41803 RepID=A0A9P0YP59_CUSEU|nr:unnamed protein product [Cuscuta europaea]
MEFPSENSEHESTPKLSLTKLPTKHRSPLTALTPPLHAPVSVPFQWEEAPGKPISSATCENSPLPPAKSNSVCRSLDLPPRLHSTTANAGFDLSDEISRSTLSSFSSFRSLDEGLIVRILKRESKEVGAFSFSPPLTPGGGDRKTSRITSKGNLDLSFSFSVRDAGYEGSSKKVARVGRRSNSLLKVSRTTSTRLLTSICESLKHAVPWRWKVR